MDTRIAAATLDQAPLLARLINLAGEGIPQFLWQQSAPDQPPVITGAERASRETGGFSYRNARVLYAEPVPAEPAPSEPAPVGMCLAYPLEDPYDTSTLDSLPTFIQPLIRLEAQVAGSWYINALAVLDEWQRKGLGRALLEDSENLARQQGLSAASIIVNSDNPGALHLYKSLNYRELASEPCENFPGGHLGGQWLLLIKPL